MDPHYSKGRTKSIRFLCPGWASGPPALAYSWAFEGYITVAFSWILGRAS